MSTRCAPPPGCVWTWTWLVEGCGEGRVSSVRQMGGVGWVCDAGTDNGDVNGRREGGREDGWVRRRVCPVPGAARQRREFESEQRKGGALRRSGVRPVLNAVCAAREQGGQ